MVGCFLMFVAQLPILARVACKSQELAATNPDYEVRELQMLIGSAFFGWLMLMPLVLYLVAGLGSRCCGVPPADQRAWRASGAVLGGARDGAGVFAAGAADGPERPGTGGDAGCRGLGRGAGGVLGAGPARGHVRPSGMAA